MKKKHMSPVVLGLAWLASLGAVFVLGILSAFAFHLAPGSGAGSSGNLSLDQRDVLLTIERYAGEPADPAALFSGEQVNTIPEQLEQALRGILREPDGDIREVAAFRLVRGLPARLVTGSIRQLQEIPAGPARNQLLASFLERWAQLDGRSAIAFATSVPSSQEQSAAVSAVLKGWSKQLPQEAWNWVIERVQGSRRAEPWLEIILTNLARTDLRTALTLLNQLPSERFQEAMARVVMDQILATEGPRQALGWLTEFPEGAQEAVATSVAQAWAATEPQAAAAWLEGSFPEAGEALMEVVRQWVFMDPQAAADWAWESIPRDRLSSTMVLVAEEWIASSGPVPLAQWLNERGPDLVLDGAIEALALATSEVNPATALVWAQSVTDTETRSMLEIYISREWLRQDPAEAEVALPDLLETEAARAALLEPYYEEPAVEDAAEIPGPAESN